MDQLRKDLAKSPDFQLAAVSCGSGNKEDMDELRGKTEKFLTARKTDLPTYHDPDAATRIAFVKLEGNDNFGYPTTILLDRGGRIRGVWRGYDAGMEKDVAAVTQKVLGER
jgi:hypothetical protein